MSVHLIDASRHHQCVIDASKRVHQYLCDIWSESTIAEGYKKCEDFLKSVGFHFLYLWKFGSIFFKLGKTHYFQLLPIPFLKRITSLIVTTFWERFPPTSYYRRPKRVSWKNGLVGGGASEEKTYYNASSYLFKIMIRDSDYSIQIVENFLAFINFLQLMRTLLLEQDFFSSLKISRYI